MYYSGAVLQTVEQVIDKFGGSAKVADLIGVGVSAVSNAKSRNHFPHAWRMRLWQEAKRQNFEIAPDLIGMDDTASSEVSAQ